MTTIEGINPAAGADNGAFSVVEHDSAKPVRIAMIGLGNFGQKHLQSILAEPGFSVAGIADPSPMTRAMAERLGIPWYQEPGLMLDAIRPEGVLVVTPNDLHLQHGMLCVERGIPVFIEKPVASTVEGGNQLDSAAKKAGVPILVGHHRRHNPSVEKAREVIQSGQLGKIVTASITWIARKPDSYFDTAWRREPGGGPILINLIHEIDCYRFLLGEILAVRAMTANAARGFPVEDTAAVLLRFASGAIATLVLSDAAESPWNWELASGENPIYCRQDVSCGTISGTQGSLSIPDVAVWHHVDRPDGERGWTAPMTREVASFMPDDPYCRQLRHFGRVIRNGQTPLVSASDGTRNLAVCIAISQSALSGEEVTLPQMAP